MQSRTTVLTCLLAMVVVCFVGLAMAQDQAQPGDLSESSPLKRCERRFDSMDKNHTGKVSKEAFMASGRGSARAGDIFTAKDLNHDGNLTKEEYCMEAGGGKGLIGAEAQCKARAKAMDINHDGVVSRDEFTTGRRSGGKGDELFKQKDANGDGSLTPEELCAPKGKEQPRKP